jgi:gamma-glutamyltranspeptidase
MCLNGFRLSKSMARVLKTNRATLMTNSRNGLGELFVDPKTNDVYKYNDVIRLPKLGATLQLIAQQGHDAFYNGVLTGFIVSEINENGLLEEETNSPL